jgi:DNA-binding MarR family transcriptional regulator
MPIMASPAASVYSRPDWYLQTLNYRVNDVACIPRHAGRGVGALEDGRVSQPAVSQETHPLPPTLLCLVKQLELAVRARLDDVLRPVEVTTLQYTALTVLQRRSDLSTAQLARNSFVTDQSAADMVSALRERGLIARVRDPKDRRRRILRLTAAGQELLEEVRGDVESVEAEMLAPLASAEATDLRHYITRCRAALSHHAPR